jgi:acyl carrier protein
MSPPPYLLPLTGKVEYSMQHSHDSIVLGVKQAIVDATEMEIPAEDLDDDTELFEDESAGGLGLDSLAALEVMFHVGEFFELRQLFEADKKRFRTVRTISVLVEEALRRNGVRVN